jgi:hypothetical protein
MTLGEEEAFIAWLGKLSREVAASLPLDTEAGLRQVQEEYTVRRALGELPERDG